MTIICDFYDEKETPNMGPCYEGQTCFIDIKECPNCEFSIPNGKIWGFRFLKKSDPEKGPKKGPKKGDFYDPQICAFLTSENRLLSKQALLGRLWGYVPGYYMKRVKYRCETTSRVANFSKSAWIPGLFL